MNFSVYVKMHTGPNVIVAGKTIAKHWEVGVGEMTRQKNQIINDQRTNSDDDDSMTIANFLWSEEIS